MMYPLVLDLAATGVPVAVTCRVLGFTKQGFYKWCAHPGSARDWDEAHLITAAYDVHTDDRRARAPGHRRATPPRGAAHVRAAGGAVRGGAGGGLDPRQAPP